MITIATLYRADDPFTIVYHAGDRFTLLHCIVPIWAGCSAVKPLYIWNTKAISSENREQW